MQRDERGPTKRKTASRPTILDDDAMRVAEGRPPGVCWATWPTRERRVRRAGRVGQRARRRGERVRRRGGGQRDTQTVGDATRSIVGLAPFVSRVSLLLAVCSFSVARAQSVLPFVRLRPLTRKRAVFPKPSPPFVPPRRHKTRLYIHSLFFSFFSTATPVLFLLHDLYGRRQRRMSPISRRWYSILCGTRAAAFASHHSYVAGVRQNGHHFQGVSDACVPDVLENAPGNRAVTQMPTGMEKEEEMESHLQDAIVAQQASTSGVQVDSHVIPTPKVFPVPQDRYDRTYKVRNKPIKHTSTAKYIRVHAWLSLDKEEPDYDADSEDEEWMSSRPHIERRTLEKIFDVLEAQSSDNQICLPAIAHNSLTAYDGSIVDDVYDYWINKRISATTSYGNVGVGGLIPKVRTECRKEAQGSLSPYVAFRRRAEKMQTRKNRKNDEDAYEKVLKLSYDLRKAVTLFDMVKRREKTKLALIDLDADILTRRMALADYGSTIYSQFVSKMRGGVVDGEPSKPLAEINGSSGDTPIKEPEPKKKKKSRRVRPSTTTLDREVPSRAWLKKNAEVWNKPPSLFSQMGNSPVVEVERSTQAAQDANLDGRYTFKRRRGCVYRAAIPIVPANSAPTQKPVEHIPLRRHVFATSLPTVDGRFRSIGMARRRVGRGGRVIFDRVVNANKGADNRVPKIFDPFDDEIFENRTMSFRARLHPFGEEDPMEPMPTERFFQRSDRFRFDDDEDEKAWIESYRPSSSRSMTMAPEVPTEPPDEEEPMEVDVQPEPQPEEPAEKKRSTTPPSAEVPRPPLPPVPPHSMMISPKKSSCSGNGPAGRVDPTPMPEKMCGTVSASDDWREASGSPSESNSSTDWGNPTGSYMMSSTSTSAATAVVASSAASAAAVNAEEGEARTGDLPVARQPPSVKDSVGSVTMLDCTMNTYMLTPPPVGS
ncbi:unnamed protein product [Caenorhabditis auriculariae]|uniref:Enhancer of polycomb-like protein n=1 Tax=Caenorhabditis auriculariae TaxID=2777116 RepID=A0A8S1HTA0_9PELO|nr:unnamed protein product [Caenorhabditis auriculariae]